MSSSVSSTHDVRTERMATGGEAVARLDDGRVIFVSGALADETVRVEITEAKKRFARGVVTEVLESSPQRVVPSCAHAASGECGGCDWLHIDPHEQRNYKQQIVTEQLQRLGGVEQPAVTTADTPRAHRTTVRCAVTNGRAGYRARRSDDTFMATECGAAHPVIEQLISDGRFGNATEVTIRAGIATGERLVVTNGDVRSVTVPDGVMVASADSPGDAALHETIAGRTFQISARSFFQTSFVGATALVDAVNEALHGSSGDVVDLYGGVGLLGGGAASDRLTCLVESNPSSVADAGHNLSPSVQVEHSRVERWTPAPFQTVIADPARRGLGKEAAAVIDGTGANHLVLVSCDPASLGRDAALLREQGWRYDQGKVIDLFPDTSRIEVVSRLVR